MKKYGVYVLILFLLTWPAWAAREATLQLNHRYIVYYSGIPVAELTLETKENQLQANILTHGLVGWISQYNSYSTAEFAYDAQEGYRPKAFHTQFTTRRKDRDITLMYDAEGKLIKEAVEPPDTPGKRPPVEEALKRNAYDPITVALAGWWRMKSLLASKVTLPATFTLPLYDGRHRMDIAVTLVGEKIITQNKQDHPVIEVKFKRIPVAGYSKNELRRAPKEEPEVTVYLKNDASLLPLKAEARALLGHATAVLAE